jgi:hypothetical protein
VRPISRAGENTDSSHPGHRTLIDFLTSNTLLRILVLTGLFGCGCAWLTGRAIALTWRPIWNVGPAMILIAIAVRFFHFALFQEPLLAPRTSIAELAGVLCVGFLAFRRTRARQMVEQYFWLYEANGPLGWKPRHRAGA